MLFILFAASAFRKLSSICVFSYFPFGFEGRIWDLIPSVPDHCSSFYFSQFLSFSILCPLSTSLRLSPRFYSLLYMSIIDCKWLILLSSSKTYDLSITSSFFTFPGLAGVFLAGVIFTLSLFFLELLHINEEPLDLFMILDEVSVCVLYTVDSPS